MLLTMQTEQAVDEESATRAPELARPAPEVQVEQSVNEESASRAPEPAQPAPRVHATPSATRASVPRCSTSPSLDLSDIWSAESRAASRESFDRLALANNREETLSSDGSNNPAGFGRIAHRRSVAVKPPATTTRSTGRASYKSRPRRRPTRS